MGADLRKLQMKALLCCCDHIASEPSTSYWAHYCKRGQLSAWLRDSTKNEPYKGWSSIGISLWFIACRWRPFVTDQWSMLAEVCLNFAGCLHFIYLRKNNGSYGNIEMFDVSLFHCKSLLVIYKWKFELNYSNIRLACAHLCNIFQVNCARKSLRCWVNYVVRHFMRHKIRTRLAGKWRAYISRRSSNYENSLL